MLQYITFEDKDQHSSNIQKRILTVENINELKHCINTIIDYVNNFSFPVASVNGYTGDVKFDFPVSSVNGMSGNVWLDFPVSSVNGMTGDVKFDFPVSSVNGQTGNVILTLKNLQNDIGYITSDDIIVSSVNGYTGDVILTTEDLQNDSGYITSDKIPVSSVSVTNSQLDETPITGNVKVFVPNKVSQIENDKNFYNKLTNFIKIIPNIEALSNAEPGYLYCILEEQE